MKRKKVVTSFLYKNGEILLLKRSYKVGTFRGKWAGISGYIEEESSLEAAIREIKEETGASEENLKLLKKGLPFEVEDTLNNTVWSIHPFLFLFKGDKIMIDWEHERYEWIDPKEIDNYSTVKNLKKTLFDLIEDIDLNDENLKF